MGPKVCKNVKIMKNKLGLNWAKLSSSWYWTLLELSLAKFLVKF